MKNYKYKEIDVKYKKRLGKSKISGTLKGSILAGKKILYLIFKYYLKKKANLAKKKQKVVSLKEIKLRPGTEIHDYNFKIKNAKKFIAKGDKVNFTVKFKGREMQHTDLGKDLMNRIIEETKDIAKVESKPKFEGRQMVMIIQPI